MPKTHRTLTVDEEPLRGVKVRAARTGEGDSAVIEKAFRRQFGHDLLERLWALNDMPEEEAMKLALRAQHEIRRRRRQ